MKYNPPVVISGFFKHHSIDSSLLTSVDRQTMPGGGCGGQNTNGEGTPLPHRTMPFVCPSLSHMTLL